MNRTYNSNKKVCGVYHIHDKVLRIVRRFEVFQKVRIFTCQDWSSSLLVVNILNSSKNGSIVARTFVEKIRCLP